MQLSEQQKTALRTGASIRTRDKDLECVVMRADVYDRVRQLLYNDTDWADDELRRMLSRGG